MISTIRIYMSKKIIDNLLEEMSVSNIDSDVNETDLTPLLNPCPSCGSINSVFLDPSNEYNNDEIKFTYKASAYICKLCKHTVYSPKKFKEVLEAEEAFQGRPYIRVTIKNGNITRHSLH